MTPRTALALAVALVLLTPPARGLATQTLVDQGATWRYLDDGSDQGIAWRDPGFEDSSWALGPAELGYGDGDEATVVDCGDCGVCPCDPKFTTTYFRHSFFVADASAFNALQVSILRDDAMLWKKTTSAAPMRKMPSASR